MIMCCNGRLPAVRLVLYRNQLFSSRYVFGSLDAGHGVVFRNSVGFGLRIVSTELPKGSF